MKNYTQLASLVWNQPHLCTPEYAETVLAVLSDKLNLEEGAYQVQNSERDPREESITQEGTFILPIVGSMVHRGSALQAASGINSYQKLSADIKYAISNPNVKNILLDVDSPGGTVAGAFDLADDIKEAAKVKPIYALARDSMCSAGYLIASGATKIYTTQTASVGSIGVVAMHIDQSGANKQKGVKPTFLQAGKFKTSGNPHEKLEGEHLEYLQNSVDYSYDMFVKAVSKNRGLDEQVVRDTEARVYKGQQAVDAGLADEVSTYEAVLNELSQGRVSTQKSMSKGLRMDKDQIENLEADLATASEKADKATKENEVLKAAILAEGYTITADGIVKEEAKEPEMIEVAGVLTDKASLPAHVLKALEDAAAEKADAELTKEAATVLPNFAIDEAKALVGMLASMEEGARETASKALKNADTALSKLMEETGETDSTVILSAKDQFEALVSAKVQTGMSKEAARTEVTNSPEGKELLKQALKEGK